MAKNTLNKRRGIWQRCYLQASAQKMFRCSAIVSLIGPPAMDKGVKGWLCGNFLIQTISTLTPIYAADAAPTSSVYWCAVVQVGWRQSYYQVIYLPRERGWLTSWPHVHIGRAVQAYYLGSGMISH